MTKNFKWTIFVISIIMCIITGCNKERTYDIPEAEENMANLFWEGKSNYVIIYGKNATDSEKTAAKELQKYFKSITGFKLAMYDDEKREPGELEILVGKTNRETQISVNRDELGTDGFEIKWVDKKLVIAGGEARGTLYGVYDFLETLGCRFLTVDTETIPKKETITLDTTYVNKETPAFEYRDVYWASTYDEVISAKLRLNGGVGGDAARGYGRIISSEYGNALEYAGDYFVHTFTYLIPAEEYFDTHPEYFSEINGERTAKHLYSQLCLTNKDVLRIVIDKVKDWLRANPNAKIVSVSQNDSFVINSYCTCSECKQVNREARSEAGTLIHFVNAVADSIKDEFPDVAVDTLAYQYSLTPPRNVEIRDNVIIRYCTGACSAHPIGQCSTSKGVADNISRWSKICKRIYVWDYTTNFAQYLSPYPNLHTLQANAKYFYENNVRGVFYQGQYQDDTLNGEFGELRAYILSKLLWDPYINIDEVVDEFLEAYYGEAKVYVKQYLDYIHKVVEDDGRCFNLVISATDLFKNLISDEDLQMLDTLWENAKSATEGKTLEHVKRSELSHRWYKLNSGRSNESQSDFDKDRQKLGVRRISEGENIPDVNPN